MLKILLSGASGRMGRQMAACLDGTAQIVAGVDVRSGEGDGFVIYPSFSLVQAMADVAIDFSRPEGLHALLGYALEKKLPLVLASTGYNEQDLQAIADAARTIPIFRSANLSLGVYVLRALARQVAALLPEFDVEIVEKHHRNKLDAPSGTALMLADAVASADEEPHPPTFDRTARRAVRPRGEIGISSVRGGSIVGEHEVIFAGKDEVITLSHTAMSREVFATGALRAAAFLAGKPAGRYDMDDLIG